MNLSFLGGDVEKIAAMTQQALSAERNFIIIASKSKKPTDQKVKIDLLLLCYKCFQVLGRSEWYIMEGLCSNVTYTSYFLIENVICLF